MRLKWQIVPFILGPIQDVLNSLIGFVVVVPTELEARALLLLYYYLKKIITKWSSVPAEPRISYLLRKSRHKSVHLVHQAHIQNVSP